jgi:ribulose-bisphosphate carboxylase large chain
MSSHDILATYRVQCPASEIDACADAILVEQSVEVPREVVRERFILEKIMGEVKSVAAVGKGDYRVTLVLRAITAGNDPAQLVNVLFGNTSMQRNVELEDFELPESIMSHFEGPRFGVGGLRKLTGVKSGPISMSALKPMGLGVERLAEICYLFAKAGIDVIKDDHGLADHEFCPFEERVTACQHAVERAAQETGRRSLYAPNISGTPQTVLKQLAFAQKKGVGAIMLAPMLLGLPFLAEIVREHATVPVLAHPSFSGAARIAPAALWGKFFRLFGADGIIFVNFGGRFSLPPDTCHDVARAALAKWRQLAPSFPIPAGGMTLERVEELKQFYGDEVILLVGGSILRAPNNEALLSRAQDYVAAVRGSAA